jgi:DNA transformation protein
MTMGHNPLLELKNLGAASVNILHAVGINTYEDLRNVGPVGVYCRIRQRGIHVSKVMLYALQGALLDVHWNELDPDLKKRLVEEADNHSASA